MSKTWSPAAVESRSARWGAARGFQTDPQEQTEGNVEADRAHDDFAVREPVRTSQEFQFQQEDAIERWATETFVRGFQNRPKGLEVDDVQPAQKMAIGTISSYDRRSASVSGISSLDVNML